MSNEKRYHYLARQPIYNRSLTPVGYELLFRSGPFATTAATQAPSDKDEMTSIVLQAAEVIGWHNVLGDLDAWINSSYRLIDGEVPIALPPERTVLEILETVTPTEDVVDGVVSHAFAGRRIALDDCDFGPHTERLLDISTTVKIDLRAMNRLDFAARVKESKRVHLLVLAEKVENQDELSFCQALGCDFFQGYYLGRPEMLSNDAPVLAQRERQLNTDTKAPLVAVPPS